MYTTPLRALTEEKYRELCADFGDENVGFATGDYKVNREAPIQVEVAEILWNRIVADKHVCPAEIVFGEHTLVVALGLVATGRKHALGLREGSTENATLCQALLADLVALHSPEKRRPSPPAEGETFGVICGDGLEESWSSGGSARRHEGRGPAMFPKRLHSGRLLRTS